MSNPDSIFWRQTVNSNRWHHLEAGAFCSKQCLIMEEVEWCCPQEHVTFLSHVSREDLIGHTGCVGLSCQFYWAVGIFPCPVTPCLFHPSLFSPFLPVCGKNRVLNIVQAGELLCSRGPPAPVSQVAGTAGQNLHAQLVAFVCLVYSWL